MQLATIQQTRMLKQAVKRNINRFPKDFMFQLTKKECQQVITNCDNLSTTIKYSPAMPFAFTEHGVTMLASFLRSERAVKMNIAIVRAFIALRQIAINNKELAAKIDKIENRYDKQVADIYEALELLLEEKNHREDFAMRERIGFKTKLDPHD